MDLGLRKITQNLGIKKLIRKNITDLQNLKTSFGVQINNKLDLTGISDQEIIRLQSLLKHKGMIVIPSHRILSEEEHLKITTLFGVPHEKVSYIAPHVKMSGQFNTTNDTYLSSSLWHSDYSHSKNPAHISIFQMTDTIDQEWETSFISLHQIYAKLNEDVKRRWDGIKVMYSGNDAIHPLLWVHPFTGNPSIYFDFRFAKEVFDICTNTGEILFKNINETVSHLNDLFSKKISVYTHRWCSGDIVIIDNYAISRKESLKPDYSQNASIRRTMTKGVYF